MLFSKERRRDDPEMTNLVLKKKIEKQINKVQIYDKAVLNTSIFYLKL